MDEEIVAMLEAADRGELDIFVEGAMWADVYVGNVAFVLSNGWKVIVFNDCDEWDCVDHVVSPGGVIVPAAALPDGEEPAFYAWYPEHTERWTSALNPLTPLGIKLKCDVHGDVEWVGDVYCGSCKAVYVASGKRDGKIMYPAAPAKGMCERKCGKRLFGGTAASARPMCRGCAKTVAAREKA
jgi:hypothetical protein